MDQSQPTMQDNIQEFWDSSTLSLCRVDLAGRIERYTPACKKLISGTKQLPLPSKLELLIHPEDQPDFFKDLSALYSSGVVMERRLVRLVTPDGRIILVEVSGEPWHNHAGIGGANLAFFERWSTDTVLDWSIDDGMNLPQELLISFCASLAEPAILLNTEGKIVNTNTRLQELLEYSQSDIFGMMIAELYEPDQAKVSETMVEFSRQMRSGQMTNHSIEYISKNSEQIPLTISGSLIRSNTGEVIGMLILCRDERTNVLTKDIQDRDRQLEEARKQLKHLDIVKDDFLSLIGHELKSPLANILGYSEFLCEWELSDEERMQYSEIIYSEGKNLRLLVNNILDLSYLESGRVNYEYSLESINKLVGLAAGELLGEAGENAIRIELELDEQLESLHMDAYRISQVLTNLLRNAIKFSEPGSKVRVTTQAVENGIRVSIKDQGIGIEAYHADKIFQRFGQVVEVKHHSVGAGLGLPIAKLIVEQGHGGKIWFESQGLDQGSTFMFTLPETRAKNEP